MKAALSLILAASMLLGGIMMAGPAESGEPVPTPLAPHPPIRIDSDADFPGIATAGDGSAGNPWVIENLEINGTGVGYCIYIGNTTERFVVRGCDLYGAEELGSPSEFYPDSAIVLWNVVNATLFNNTVLDNQWGIYLADTHNSTILNNSMHSNICGTYMSVSNNNTIEGNTVFNNSYAGLDLILSNNNTLIDNNISSNKHGIFLGDGANNVLEANNATDNIYGISIFNSINSVLIGNTMHHGGIIITGGVMGHWNSHIIETSNTINGKTVHYWKNRTGGTVPDGAGQVILANCTNVIVSAQNVSGGSVGIQVGYSNGNSILNNNASFNQNTGIVLESSSDNLIAGNIASENGNDGIGIYTNSNENNVIENNLSSNVRYGIYVSESDNNRIYHNNFVDNAFQANGGACMNFWNASYPLGGNYWSDYSGADSFHGENQNIPGADGMGDTPYTDIVGGGATDYYPLMEPWTAGQPLGETVPPHALGWSPNGTAVPVDAQITIAWNETMNWTSVEEAFSYTDGSNNYTSANGAWAHDSLTNVSAFTPDDDFAYETQYNVTVNCTAKDIIGNLLDRNLSGTGGEWPADVLQWNFTTDDEAPYVVSTQPANGQTGVDPNKPLRVVFSERMNETAVEDSFSYTDGNETWNITAGLGTWNAMGTEFAFTPAFALELNTTYTATLDGALATDVGGKGLKNGDHAWTFTTWLEPPAPKITSTYPPNGATKVNVNTYINVFFDCEMDIPSVEAAFSYTDGAGNWTMDDGAADWFSGNTLFSFQPAQNLNFDSNYEVRIASSAMSVYGIPLDGNGNGISDANDNYTFGFRTIPEPPVVVSHYPGKNEADVPIDIGAIYINFSKVMLLPTMTGAIAITPTIPFTPFFTGGGMNLTIILGNDLYENLEYRVSVLGTVTDMDGNALDGDGDGVPGDRFTFTFKTEGEDVPEMPEITHVFPDRNATNVPVEPFYVEIWFNVPMNRTSVENAFSFKNASEEVSGTFRWSNNSMAIRFIPGGKLAYNTTYTVSVDGTACDQDGRPVGAADTWHYITMPEEGEEKSSLWMWATVALIIAFAALAVMLFMANRALRMELKRTRVKLKRMKREMAAAPALATAAVEGAVPEEIMPDDVAPSEANEGRPPEAAESAPESRESA